MEGFMKVQDVMNKSPKFCSPSTNLAAVTELLWSGGCGALPVVDSNREPVGIITDRDICVALGTRNRRPSELVAEQVMSHPAATCRSTDDIHGALGVMRNRKIRRLPVVNGEGKLEGVVCLSDLIVHARHNDGIKPEISYEDLMSTLKCINWRHSPVLVSTL
jgi:CBS domain-containing protein